jgi:hypothetical protein
MTLLMNDATTWLTGPHIVLALGIGVLVVIFEFKFNRARKRARNGGDTA